MSPVSAALAPVRHLGTRGLLGLLAAAALVAPGASWSLAPGLPLTPFGLVLAALALTAAVGLPAPPHRRALLPLVCLALALAFKLVLAATTPPVGLLASYWSGPSMDGPPERSTDFRSLTQGTCLDPALDFQANGFPVHFFNDAARFNLSADARPGRDQLPFAVRWDGWLSAPTTVDRKFEVAAVGPARVWLDDREVLTLGPGEGTRSADVTIPVGAGLHPLRVEYQRPAFRVPLLRVLWQPSVDGPLVPIAAPDVFWQPVGEGAPSIASAVPTLGHVADALIAAGVAAWILLGLLDLRGADRRTWTRAGLAVIPLLFLLYGVVQYADLAGRVTILSGQDDWLTHESLARDILLNGPLMTAGHPTAAPFYAQPLYPYVLAAVHVLTGEGLFGVLVLQLMAVGVTLSLVGLLAGTLFGWAGGLAALAFFWAFLQQEHLRVARQLLNENLYMPLVMASLLVLAIFARRRAPPAWWKLLLAGALLGLTALTRSQFLLFLPFALALLTLAWGREPDHSAAVEQEPAAARGDMNGAPAHPEPVEPRAPAHPELVEGRAGAAGRSSRAFSSLDRPAGPSAATSRTSGDSSGRSAPPTDAKPWTPHRRPGPQVIGAVALLLAGIVLAIAPATARNLLVSGQPVLISSAAGQNLLNDHAPPAGFDLSGIDRDPLYNALHLDAKTRTVVEYARRDPAGYFATWLPLGAHSIGLTGFRRGDGSVYRGFLATVVLYLAAFVLRRVRRLEVWLVHAFVATHFLVMMLFSADTYGFRLVLPMYAPIVVVAAQVPLAVATWLGEKLSAARWPAFSRLPAALAGIFALGALAQQGQALAASLSDRDLAYHGLVGLAAHAAATAEASQADLAYVASGDGQPRHFGTGNLPGLRYPELKWFDPARSVPIPPDGARAVYALGDVQRRGADAQRLVSCLGTPNAAGELTLIADQANRLCLGAISTWQQVGARFGDLAQVDAVAASPSATAGDTVDAQVAWRVLAQPSQLVQIFAHLEDPDPSAAALQWGNGTAELYPSSEWEPGERLLSRLPIQTDPAAVPGSYRLAVGFSQGPDSTALTATGPGGSSDRVAAGTVDLRPGSARPLTPDTLPAGMQALSKPVEAGGLELLALRSLAKDARPGERLQVGLLWRATGDAPTAARLRLELVGQDGQVVQQSTEPLLGGRYSPADLRAGTVVRDEHALLLTPQAPNGPLVLRLDLLDASGKVLGSSLLQQADRPATVQVEGRQRDFAPPADMRVQQAASLGSRADLLGFTLEPASVRAGGAVTLRLYWRAQGQEATPYTVFTHVLDPSQQRVVAQNDAEPQNGAAPTSGWLADEIVRDEHKLAIPAGTPPGNYPVEVGLYDPRTGQRLALPDGATRVLLSAPLRVDP